MPSSPIFKMNSVNILCPFAIFMFLASIHHCESISSDLDIKSHIALTSSREDRELSKYDNALSQSVTSAAHIAIRECGFQFKYEKWNCPKKAFFPMREHYPHHGNGSSSTSELFIYRGHHATSAQLKRPSNKETAFVHAITAAGIAHTLIKNCSAGEFDDCGCDFKTKKRDTVDWKWRGCSDNFDFGDQVAKKFLDTIETGSDPNSLANLHNNEAGRVAVRKRMKRACKCHGVSGSCATQTCWNTLSDFRTVGSFLKKMWKQAVRVDYINGQLNQIKNGKKNNGRGRRGSSGGKGKKKKQKNRKQKK